MTPERWNQIKDAFYQAADCSPESRAVFLRDVCGEDQELRREVESLLAADAQTGSVLEIPPMETVTETSTHSNPFSHPSLPDDTFGPYVPVRTLGEGGMGTVYLARQTHPILREVALKVVRVGMDSRPVLERFEIERQALAMMDHPNVARVLDAGTSQRGRPYFVMEFVDGVPITKYCDQRVLSTRHRLQLFIPVCLALQHAHKKGIIHRDVKPSNILVMEVDEQPVPKVIDFGIARAVERPSVDCDAFTLDGQILGTPLYMSPEQASLDARDIDTGTDVYSLGIVLYELLVGALPLDLKSLRKIGLVEVLRAIRETPVPTLAARLTQMGTAAHPLAQQRSTSPSQLRRDLTGDVDSIVMKAIEKDRLCRYASASELAADIERHLRCEPIWASPPSVRYRLNKFVARHKLPVATAAALALALVGGIVGTAWEARVAGQERLVAVGEKTEAEKQRNRAKQQAVEAAKQRDAARTARDEVYLAERTAMKERDRAEAERSRAEIERKTAEQQRALAEESNRHLSQNRWEYISIFSQIAKSPTDRVIIHHAARTLRSIAVEAGSDVTVLQEVADAFTRLADGDSSSMSLEQGLLFRPPTLEVGSWDFLSGSPSAAITAFGPRYPRDTDAAVGGSDDFRGLYNEAVTIWEKLVRLRPRDVHIRLSLSLDYDRLALLEGVSGNLEGALGRYRLSASHLQQVADENPSPGFQSLLSLGNLRVANILAELRRNDEALNQYGQSVSVYRKLLAGAPRNAQLSHALVAAYLKRAEVFLNTGDYERAETDYSSSLQVVDDPATEGPSTQIDRAAIVERIARLALSRGDLGGALRSYKTSLEFYKRLASKSLTNNYNRQYNAEDLSFLAPVSPRLFEVAFRNWSWWTGEIEWIRPVEQINSSKEQPPAIGRVGRYILAIVEPNKTLPVGGFDIQSQRSSARCYAEVGHVEMLLGQLVEARAAIRRSLTIREQLAALYPNSVLFATDLAASLELGGDLDTAAGDSESAYLSYRTAIELAKRLAIERGDSGELARVARLLVKVVALEPVVIVSVGGLSSRDLRQIAINIYQGFSAEPNATVQMSDQTATALVTLRGDDSALLSEAYTCAMRATDATKQKNPFYLHTMAMVYDKQAKYNSAVETERRAMAIISDGAEDFWENSLTAVWTKKLAEYERHLRSTDPSL